MSAAPQSRPPQRLSTVPARAPQPGIPATPAERRRLQAAADQYAAGHELLPPLSLNGLYDHAAAIQEAQGADRACREWVMVLLNNATWRSRVAAIPFERRLLLLPRCVRDVDQCQATMDELGLICRHCGGCVLDRLTAAAEELGYVTLISEGTAAVLGLLQSGRVDGFVGASCMSVLRKVFPVVSMLAVPALAMPLLYDGCKDTALDVDWLEDAIRLRSG